MKIVLISFIALTVCFSGCKSSQKQSAPQEIQTKNMLIEISNNPSEFVGKSIEIAGKYLGYNASDCKFPENFCAKSPETRSDWVFNEAGSCIYVTGGKPSEYSGLTVPETDPLIMLKATVAQNAEKKVYLKFISSQVITLPEFKK